MSRRAAAALLAALLLSMPAVAARAASPRSGLAVVGLGDPPSALRPGAPLLLSATVGERSEAETAPSTVSVWLSRDATPDRADLRLPARGDRFAAPDDGRRLRRGISLRIPLDVRAGVYRVLACVGGADPPRPGRPSRVPCRTARVRLRIVPALPGLPGVVPRALEGRAPPPPAPPPGEPVAPPLARRAASVADRTRFLWSGPEAQQRGVAAGALDARRIALVRGRVRDGGDRPLAGARVRVLGHPELGVATSRDGGTYDLAVNGGGRVVIDVTHPGYLPAQREMTPGWQEILAVDDVRLAPAGDGAAVRAPASRAADPIVEATGPAPPGTGGPRGAGVGAGNGTPETTPGCEPIGGVDAGCERQSVGETIPVAGTPFSLRYRSDRQPGYLPTRTIELPVTGAEVPGPLKRVEVSVDVAGRHFARSYPPRPDQRFRLVWDGRDGWGRPVTGAADARITLTNVYPADDPGRGQTELRLVQTVTRPLGVPDPRDTDGLGGFTLDVHDSYDPGARALFRGDGSVARTGATPAARRIAGGGRAGVPHGAGGAIDATDARLPTADIASGPDGTVYVADPTRRRVYRITPDGRLRGFAGNGERGAPTGDGGPASRARLGRRLLDVAAGPDGSVYLLVAVGPSTSPDQQIRRIAPDGTITTVAGAVGATDQADGIPAKDAFVNASSLAVGPDGAVYLDDYNGGRLRRIAPDGRIGTLAGGGTAEVSTTPQPGRAVRLGIPAHPALGPDGSVYLATEYQNRVLRLTPDGSIAVVAGTGEEKAGAASGRATGIGVPAPRRLGVALDGTLYIASAETYASGRAPIVSVSTTGRLTPFAGDSRCGRRSVPESVVPLAECMAGSDGLTVLPDGSVVYAGPGGVLRRTGSPFPGFGASMLRIPSADGRMVDVFDRHGRHLETRDALTNGLRLRFGYDATGRLTSIVDGSGAVTRILRERDGRPTAIVAPGGARTTLAVSRNGDLATVTNPLGGAHELGYGPGGLLRSMTDPGGGVTALQYDDRGRLTRAIDPDGVRLDLARTAADEDTVAVAATDGDGQTTTYRIQRRPDGSTRRTVTSPAGAAATVITAPDGTTRRREPDGTTSVERRGPDPRFGLLAPIVESSTTRSPAGRSTTLVRTRRVTFGAGWTPARLQDDVTIDGRRRTWVYAAPSRTLSLRTAAGRRWSWTFDRLGRVRRIRPPGEAPVIRTFDRRGRLTRTTQGSSALRLAYDAAGHVIARTPTGGPTLHQRWDAADRLRSVTEAGATVTYGYDADGHRTSVRLPRGGTYTRTVSPAGRERSWTAPGDTAAFTQDFTRGGRLERQTLPSAQPPDPTSGRSIAIFADPGGRLSGRSGGGVQTNFIYAGDTDRLATLIRAGAGSAAQPEPAATLALAYDGAAPTSLTWGGPFDATSALRYDGAGRLTRLAETVGGVAAAFAIPHDPDGMATGIGAFAFIRRAPGGRVSRARAGPLAARFGVDRLGRPDARVYTVAGRLVYREALRYDGASRVVARAETSRVDAGRLARRTLTFGYDAASRLVRVRRGSAVVERYEWDADGNRSTRRLDEGRPETTTYDTGDRIARAGDIAFTVDADGFVTRRGGDRFAYTADGELIRAIVAGRTISYRYDGLGRRIVRAGPGGMTRYLYDDPRDAWRVTATIGPGGGVTYYLYDDAGLLLAIERSGRRFLVATDASGTPHVVADAAGTVRRRIVTDSFGRIIKDSAPSFPLAVGFAGGLADPDTGLVRLGPRDYDPETGRFTARDPARSAAADPNLYAFAGGDPVARMAPEAAGGEAACGDVGGSSDPLDGSGGIEGCGFGDAGSGGLSAVGGAGLSSGFAPSPETGSPSTVTTDADRSRIAPMAVEGP